MLSGILTRWCWINVVRVLFMGTPEYARVILEGLHREAPVELRVVTKPDMPVGRRRIITPSPVAAYALAHQLPLDRPARVADAAAGWREWQPDLIITAAYGKILPAPVLDLPRWGAYNLHASLLPRWRGANPIAWAILAGDRETGVSLMAMETGIDTGPIVATRTVAMGPDETLGGLTAKLANEARDLVLERLADLCPPDRGRFWPQPKDGVTYAPKFDAKAAAIDWTRPASEIERQVRGMNPEPGAYTTGLGVRIKVLQAIAVEDETLLAAGEVRTVGDAWQVGTGRGLLRIIRIQPAGRTGMTPGDWMRGRRDPGRVVLQ